MALTINVEGAKKLGSTIKGYLEMHTNDRKALETQWAKNLRQYLGVYDQEVKNRLSADRSHAYPRDTWVKVTGYVAKLMEMMFPSQERNWELKNSAVPSIPKEALEAVIETLRVKDQAAAQEEGREPREPTSEDIEREVIAYSNARKEEMEQEIADQLDDEDTDYPNLCKRVLRSGGIYGVGIARSPMVRLLKERVWERGAGGKFKAVAKTVRRPYPEYVRVWDIFPDLTAITWRDQDRIFERMVMGRRDFSALRKRPDFIEENISRYLKDHQKGNYTEREYETELRTLGNTSNVSHKESRRYEIFRFLGYVTAHELTSAGVEVDEKDMDDDVLADIWIVDDTVIKAEVAAFGERPADQYPAFIATEDEDSGLTGIGLPEQFRDSQMAICASNRAMLDNMAVTAGPIFEVNIDLMTASQAQSIGAIHAFQVIKRSGEGQAAAAQAVREINVQSNVQALLAITKDQREQLDRESNLPSLLFGNPEAVSSEAFRTTSNMSMMIGGANMVSKDTVRAFDKFTTQFIGGFLKWNMEFNENERIKGDFGVRAKGNFSLVAKEIRGAALDQFMQTLTPQDRAMFDIYGIQLDRLKARDLPLDRLLTREEATAAVQAMAQGAAQANEVASAETQSKTAKNMADADKTQTETEAIKFNAAANLDEIKSRVAESISRARNDSERTAFMNISKLLDAAAETPKPVGASDEPE